MNIIKYIMAKLAAKITDRKCILCTHNHGGRCRHYDKRMFSACWLSITRPGFHRRAPQGPTKPSLTAEEQRQLQKLRGILDEAEDTARESGLLTED